MKGSVLLLCFCAVVAVVSAGITPFGWRPNNCVKEVPSGTRLVEAKDGVYAHHPNGTIAFHPSDKNCGKIQEEFAKARWERAVARKNLRSQRPGSPAYTSGWLDNAGYFPPTEVDVFSGTYNIPGNPPKTDGQVLFYFIGTENLKSSSQVSILQPVLTWGNGQTGWNMASWNCCPGNQTWHSNSLLNLKAGGSVSGKIDQSSSSAWTITSTYNGQNAVLTVPTISRDFNWVDVTLETYDVVSCQDFPTSAVTFSSMALTLTGGTKESPSWQPWKEPTECGGSLTVVSPSEIKIDHTT